MNKTVVALGFFDGVHVGHAEILKKTIEKAGQLKAQPAAITFTHHPRMFVRGIAPPILTPFETRRRLMTQLGVERVFSVPFDEKTADLSPDDFILMLKHEYGAVAVVCGQSFRFGKNAAGGADSLSAAGLRPSIVPPITVDGQVVSSTLIRRALEAGRLKQANTMLGRSFFMEGQALLHDEQNSITLCPTEGALLPAHGVYAGYVRSGQKSVPSLINIGTRPTVSSADIVSISARPLSGNFDKDNNQVSFIFDSYIRGQQCFTDRNELKMQIERDLALAEEVLCDVD